VARSTVSLKGNDWILLESLGTPFRLMRISKKKIKAKKK